MTPSMGFVLGDKVPAADAGREQYVTARKLPCASPQLFIRIPGVARPVPGQPYTPRTYVAPCLGVRAVPPPDAGACPPGLTRLQKHRSPQGCAKPNIRF